MAILEKKRVKTIHNWTNCSLVARSHQLFLYKLHFLFFKRYSYMKIVLITDYCDTLIIVRPLGHILSQILVTKNPIGHGSVGLGIRISGVRFPHDLWKFAFLQTNIARILNVVFKNPYMLNNTHLCNSCQSFFVILLI